MADSPGPRDVGRHLLGPHVVGQRVVVRRLLRGEIGPTGGPAFTDVLGTCLSWSGGVTVLETERGERVQIAVADIVSGKPVPPRPSPRLRVSARDAESATGALFPTVGTVPLGAWTIRWEPEPEGRLRKRANSCLAMGPPGMPVPEALTQVAGFYAARARRPLVQVEQGSEVEAAAELAGWQPVAGGDTVFLMSSAAMLRRRLRPLAGAARVEAEGDRALATVVEEGIEWARGRAGVSGDWLGVHDLLVGPERRRQGLAREVLGALLAWGSEEGASTVWLHVETHNAPALALYESLGFAEHHRCRYLEAPGHQAQR